jgi:hypothetical protein
MNTLSVSTICQDEEEVIGAFLECCMHLSQALGDDLHEVVLVDGGSADGTVDIIRSYADKLPLVLAHRIFDNFGQQKNFSLEMTTGDYVFGPDPDMTWTTNFPSLFQRGFFDVEPFWHFPIEFTADDAWHYFWQWPTNYNVRLWKRGPKYVTNFHEKLEGSMHAGVPVCQDVWLFENSCRQSDAALLHRGRRYQKFAADMIAAGGGPGPEDRYVNAARESVRQKKLLPKHILSMVLPSTNFRGRPDWSEHP